MAHLQAPSEFKCSERGERVNVNAEHLGSVVRKEFVGGRVEYVPGYVGQFRKIDIYGIVSGKNQTNKKDTHLDHQSSSQALNEAQE